MAIILIGIGDQGSGGTGSVDGYNYLETEVAADGSGTIIQFDFLCDNVNDGTLVIGLTALSGTSATPYSNVTIDSGSDINQLLTFTSSGGDFTPPNVLTGHILQFSSNNISSTRDDTLGLGYFDQDDYRSTPFTASLYSGLCVEISGIGTTGSENSWNGADWPDYATFDGIATGDISTIDGITMWDGEIVVASDRRRHGIIRVGRVSAKRYPENRQRDLTVATERFLQDRTRRYFDLDLAA